MDRIKHSYRRLHPTDPADVRDLQRILEAAPSYSRLVEGRDPPATAGRDELAALPPGKTHDDKFTFAIEHDGQLIGCADLMRGHPDPNTAYLGLLLFAETFQGQGHGVAALVYLETLAASWGCTAMRLAVIATNLHALQFWQRQGFVELYRKPAPQYTGDAVVLQRAIAVPGLF